MNHQQFLKRSLFFIFSLIIFISCSSSEDVNKEDVDDTLLPIPSTNYDTTPILIFFDNIEAVSYSVSGARGCMAASKFGRCRCHPNHWCHGHRGLER